MFLHTNASLNIETRFHMLSVAWMKTGSSRSRPGSRQHSTTRHQGESSRSIIPPPPMPPPQNAIQHEGIHTQHNIYQGNTAPSSHTRNQLPSWIPATHSTSMHHGRIHTQQNVQEGNTTTRQGGAAYHTQQHRVYRGSSNVYHSHDERGIQHIACSNRGCEKAGAKQCITQSCASCCYFRGSRSSCPRHQNMTAFAFP